MSNSYKKICITYTCLSTNSQIVDNIRWHNHLKTHLFILFLDKQIEEFKIHFKDYSNVLILRSACYKIKDKDPSWVKEAYVRLAEGYDFEKLLNVYHASKIAYTEFNCDWMISIDADELIYIPVDENLKSHSRAVTFPDFFNNIPGDVLQVRFEAAELIPTGYDSKDSIFRGVNYFATFPSKPVTIFGRILNRLMLFCNISEKTIESIISFYYFIFGYNIRNSWQNIIKNKKCIPYFMGYMGYKSAIKLPINHHSVFSIHYWLNKWPHPQIKTLNKKYCLHFDLPSFDEYRKKSLYQFNNPLRFQNRREIFEIGRSSDLSCAFEYYNTKIVVSEDRIKDCKSAITVLLI